MSFVQIGKYTLNKNIINSISIQKRLIYIKYPWKVIVKTTGLFEQNYKCLFENETDAILEKRKIEMFLWRSEN